MVQARAASGEGRYPKGDFDARHSDLDSLQKGFGTFLSIPNGSMLLAY
jgi:hypothetical protein